MFWNKRRNNSFYSTVTVNGKTIHVKGNNISIIDDRIIVDGKPLEESMDTKNITVIVEGNCNRLDTCGSVEVRGDCHYVDCGGSCKIAGNVTGDVDANGSVSCCDVGGNINACGTVQFLRR